MTIAEDERKERLEELERMSAILSFRYARDLKKLNTLERLIEEYEKEIKMLEEET